MDSVAAFEHLLKSLDVSDLLDEIASADPPAYLRRSFAEGCSAPGLNFARVQELALCAMVLDSIINQRDYEVLEPELISDWRLHYGHECTRIRDTALSALRRARASLPAQDSDAAAELVELEHRLTPG